MLELEASRLRGDPWDYRPRVILVLDSNDNIVGTLRQFEILKALEPKYQQAATSMEPRFRQVLEYPGSERRTTRRDQDVILHGAVSRLGKNNYG